MAAERSHKDGSSFGLLKALDRSSSLENRRSDVSFPLAGRHVTQFESKLLSTRLRPEQQGFEWGPAKERNAAELDGVDEVLLRRA